MTEFKAIVLTMATALLVEAIVLTALIAMHADGNLIALAFVVLLVVGADTCSRVVGHYSDEQ